MEKSTTNISKIWFIIFIILLIITLLAIVVTPSSSKKELTLATGSIGSDSYAYGLSYKALLEDEGVILNILPTQGSLDTLGYLNQKKADIGFVHSGLLINKREYDFESLGSVYYEPLWIFYRNEGYQLNYLIEAIDKKVGISITNDGAYETVDNILKANKLTQLNRIYIQDNEALNYLKSKKIDLFITLATKENQYIENLMLDPSINLMSIKRVAAYVQKFDYLKSLKLFEGSLNLYRNIPSKDINLLSTTQNLVATKTVQNKLIRIFLKKVQQIHNEKTFFYGGEKFLNMASVDTLMNEEAKLYIQNGESWLESIFPYWIASNIDRLKLLIIPLVWLIIPLLKSIIPLYIFTTRSRIFKWYEDIDKIYAKIDNAEDKEQIKKDIKKLQSEIPLKTEVPLSYKGEFYNLLLHIEILQNKLLNNK